MPKALCTITDRNLCRFVSNLGNDKAVFTSGDISHVYSDLSLSNH